MRQTGAVRRDTRACERCSNGRQQRRHRRDDLACSRSQRTLALLHCEQSFVPAEVGYEARPPERDPETTVDQALLEDEEDDEDKEDESGEDEHAVHPIRLLERGDEVLGRSHKRVEDVVRGGCGLERGGRGFCIPVRNDRG